MLLQGYRNQFRCAITHYLLFDKLLASTMDKYKNKNPISLIGGHLLPNSIPYGTFYPTVCHGNVQVLPPPTAASVQGVRTQTEKNGSTYDQVLIIACLISVVAAIIFSVTCFLGIRFGCRWRKDENVEFAQTSQKLYPNHPSSASSHQVQCIPLINNVVQGKAKFVVIF